MERQTGSPSDTPWHLVALDDGWRTHERLSRVTGQILECARAEALFVSYVQRSDTMTADTIRSAIRHTVRQHGTRGCAEMVAHEFGEHPETAVGRMTWALRTVRGAYTTAA